MLKFSGFKKFIYLNNIDEDTLRKAINYFELRLVKKDEFLFHESEPSKFFAGLIKGKISFRKSKIFNVESGEIILRSLYKIVEKKEDLSNKKRKFSNKDSTQSIMTKLSIDIKDNQIENKRISVNNFQAFKSLSSNFSLIDESYKIVKEYFNPLYYRVTEDEIFQAESGYCFGEWALIYNQPRSASVIALEDSVFFILDEKIFAKTFLKCLTSSEHRKKKFILENLFPFNLYNERRNSLYKDIVPKSYVRNQLVFNEGDPADTIYLIYSGTFFLEKIFKNKVYRFKSVEKGTLLGLESIFEEGERKYKCTMKLSSLNEFGIVACCKVSKLVPYIIQKMKVTFKKNYELYLETNEFFYIKNINYENNILFKKSNTREENPKTLDKYIEDCSLIEREEKIKNKKIKFNNLKQTQLEKEQKQNININTNSLSKKKKKKRKFKLLRKIKRSKTIKAKQDANYGKFIDEKRQICYVFRKKNPIRRMNTIAPSFQKINLNKGSNNTETISSTNKINTTPNLKIIESNKENNLNDLTSIKTRKVNVDLYLKDLLSYTYQPSIFEDLKEKSKSNKIKLKTEERKSLNKTFFKKFNIKSYETPLSRNKHEINTERKEINFTELPMIKSNKNFKFDSGKFKLPLMAQIFK